jgi:hypothetical protein
MSKYTYEIIANIINQLYFPGVEDQKEVRKAVAEQFAKTLQVFNPKKFNKLKFMRTATNNPAK